MIKLRCRAGKLRRFKTHLINSALSAKLGIKTEKGDEKPANLLDGKKMGNESLRPLPGPTTAKDVSIQIADLLGAPNLARKIATQNS